MNEKEAIEICEEYGWEITKAKYFLFAENSNDKVFFNTKRDLINYAKELEKGRHKWK